MKKDGCNKRTVFLNRRFSISCIHTENERSIWNLKNIFDQSEFQWKDVFFNSILNVTKRHANFTTSFFGCFKCLKLQDVLQTRKS